VQTAWFGLGHPEILQKILNSEKRMALAIVFLSPPMGALDTQTCLENLPEVSEPKVIHFVK